VTEHGLDAGHVALEPCSRFFQEPCPTIRTGFRYEEAGSAA
jgi:hypothetical protein